jgi:hypothetical protein
LGNEGKFDIEYNVVGKEGKFDIEYNVVEKKENLI